MYDSVCPHSSVKNTSKIKILFKLGTSGLVLVCVTFCCDIVEHYRTYHCREPQRNIALGYIPISTGI